MCLRMTCYICLLAYIIPIGPLPLFFIKWQAPVWICSQTDVKISSDELIVGVYLLDAVGDSKCVLFYMDLEHYVSTDPSLLLSLSDSDLEDVMTPRPPGNSPQFPLFFFPSHWLPSAWSLAFISIIHCKHFVLCKKIYLFFFLIIVQSKEQK